MKYLSSKSFYDSFTKTDQSIKRYIFGINQYADSVAKVAVIDGYIDQYTDKSTYNGKPIVKLEDIRKDSLVLSTVTYSRPKTAIVKIEDAGIQSHCDYFAFADASEGKVPQLSCVADMRIDYGLHEPKYEWIRGLLVDDESITTFDRIMNFRLKADLKSLDDFSFRVDQQYFEPFLGLEPGEVFVDGGGYDGFTTLEFAKRCPSYHSVHFFEPSEKNLLLARQNLGLLENINYHQLGLYKERTTLCFDSGDGSACRISDSGSEKIEVDSLDNVVDEKTTFIKLDLEGAEMYALKGMKDHILKDHPKIAVAIYHQPSDFRDIPSYILGLRNDYDVYMRHYTEGWAETIMFFVPRKK